MGRRVYLPFTTPAKPQITVDSININAVIRRLRNNRRFRVKYHSLCRACTKKKIMKTGINKAIMSGFERLEAARDSILMISNIARFAGMMP